MSLEERGRRIGIPTKILREILAPGFNAEQHPVPEAVRFLAPGDPRPILILAGDVGRGKSCAAAYAALHARSPDNKLSVIVDGAPQQVVIPGSLVKVLWVHAKADLAQHLFDQQLWDRLAKIDVLIVDDAGDENRDERVQASITSLLAMRCDWDRKTIVTHNLDPATFAARYGGARLIDRMVGDAWVGSAGPSMRKRSA
jgi:DNA replication protein DnaC